MHGGWGHAVRSRLPWLFMSLGTGALAASVVYLHRDTVDQLVSIYIVTFIIGLGHLHHSIAGAAEMFTALFMGAGFPVVSSLRFMGFATTGNLVGGSLFVAGLNYAHIRKSQPPPRDRS